MSPREDTEQPNLNGFDLGHLEVAAELAYLSNSG